MIKFQKTPAIMMNHTRSVASLASSLVPVGPMILFGSIAALDTLYLAKQAVWAADLSFGLLPIACILALGLILYNWLVSAGRERTALFNANARTSARFAHLWHSPLAEVITLMFAFSWWFRRDTPDAPSGIAFLFTLIGLCLMIWLGTRQGIRGVMGVADSR